MLDVRLASETCGGVPPAVEAWLAERVRQAVRIEFDRFIAAGQLAERAGAVRRAHEPRRARRLAGLDV